MPMQLKDEEILLCKKKESTTRMQVKNGEISLFRQLQLKKSVGRCMILAPENEENDKKDNTLLKALVRAHLWQRQIKEGKYATTRELCTEINVRHIQRILRLNYLAPRIKENILNGTQPRNLKLADLKKIPHSWNEQMKLFYGQ
ncbi:hypothetical protein [Wolbachia endosymbiont of Folsomia candida]|uniref:hypothetical protein n=1 Tax=Wolbachia endosymbiont of Folsomia candida TaxID=169402 RepID=UPI000AFC9771|nr:hypothetical protein [Wolbachia endosymbiont of Folsomia candida]APR97876.1 hypothetical protein ASM33_00850 [Wolbachia endosymbiont of Folsomia candida]